MKKIIILLCSIVLFTNTKSQVNLDSNINSMYFEYRPIISADGKTIFFTVERNPDNKFKDGQDIWTAKKVYGKWVKPVRLPNHINSERFNTVFWTSSDGNRILIRGSKKELKTDIMRLGFSMVTKCKGVWGTPEPIVIDDYKEITQGKFTTATLSSDEKIMILSFSQPEDGEFLKLWISKFNDSTGTYSRPEKLNLGNEKSDEINPFIAPDDKTLYYSTNKKGGIGGFDIWVSRRLDTSWTNWSPSENLGEPINTKKADTYFSISKEDTEAYTADNFTYGIPDEKGGFDIKKVAVAEKFLPQTYRIDTIFIHDTLTISSICNPLDTMTTEQLQKELLKYKILFDFGSSVLRSDAFKKLDIIIALMKKNPSIKIELGGHSDALGDVKKNQKQSDERANSTRGYLLSRGIDETRVLIKGYSNTEPVADNKTDFGRQLNRRVDIKIFE